MSTKSRARETSENAYDDLLGLLYRERFVFFVIFFFFHSVIAWLTIGHVPLWVTGLWLGLSLLVISARLVAETRLAADVQISVRSKLRVSAVFSAASGIAMGAGAVIFYPYLPSLAGVMSGAIANVLCALLLGLAMGYPPIVMGYSVPAIALGISGLIINSANQTTEQQVEPIMVLAVLAYMSVLFWGGRALFSHFATSSDLRHSQGVLNTKLEQALREAKEASEAKTRFLASASHDLRQPMHTLSLYATALLLREQDAKSRNIVERMNEAVSVLTNQMDSLLDISKLDAGIVDVRPEMHNAAATLDQVVAVHRAAAEDKGLKLILEYDRSIHVRTDPQLLTRIVGNLLSNAVKHTHKGHIVISAKLHDQKLLISIRDTGIGIDASEVDRIFEEFYQLNNPERDRQKGLGLGLSIVKRLSEFLGGCISVTSELGAGSTFSVVIENMDFEHQRTEVDSFSLLEWSPKKVLVVDDEQTVREGMAELLEHLDCNVTVAGGVEEALQKYQQGSVDIALVDFRLRGSENGVDLIKKLRAFTPSLPAILVSGDTAADRLQFAKREGIRLLHKPVSVDALKQEITLACDLEDGHQQ